MSIAKSVGGKNVSRHSTGLSGSPVMSIASGRRKIIADLLPGFSRRLAAMLQAGLPIVASLNSLERQARYPAFRLLIEQVRKAIENGAALSEALKRFPLIFDDLYVNTIRAGENSGQLAESIARLSLLLEASARLQKKVKAAMIYPLVVLCVAILITAGMIIFVVPVFADMFASFRQQLHGPTLFLLKLSDFLKRFSPYIVLALTAGIIAFNRWKRTASGAYALDRFVLNLPVFGDLVSKVASARFARVFGQLIHSGVPILSSLEISAGATGNKVAARLVMASIATVERGDSLSSAMLGNKVFDPMLVDMLQAGEQTGEVDDMMHFTADYFDEEVNTTLNGLTSLLEPLFIVILGVIIGGIVICMFLPIFRLSGVVTG